MKIDRKTLAFIIAALCGVGSVSQGQDGTLLSLAGHSPDRLVQPASANLATSAADGRSASGSLSDKDDNDAARVSDDFEPQVEKDSSSTIPGSLTGYESTTAGCDPGTYAHEDRQWCESGGARATSTGRSSQLGWLDFDTLFWWGRGLTHSPVISGSTAEPTVPLLGGTENPIGTDMLFGLRADTGFWLDDCQNYGVGGRVWGILSDGQTQVINNGGNPTSVEFFDVNNFGVTDYLPVNDAPRTGEIRVLNDLDLFSGELYLRSLLIGDRNNRTELLTGYTFLRLDSVYRLETDSQSTVGPANRVTTLDQFVTTNTFHGGHLGLSNQLNRGRFGFDLSGKVALGNMESTSRANGATTGLAANPGFFVRDSNDDPITRDRFTFIPEVNTKMRYRLGRAELGIGYTLVLLPEVAMASSQIDKYVDPFPGLNASPRAQFNTEAYYLHGLDLGLSFRF